MYAVPDAATLQRWVLEQRVSREDAVSLHGMRWTPLGERPDFALFFAAVDRLAANRPTLSPAPSPLATRPVPTEPHPAPRHDEEIFVEETDILVGAAPGRFGGVDELPAAMAAAAYSPYDPIRPPAEEESATVVERSDRWLDSLPPPVYTPPYAPSARDRMLEPDPETQEATIESRRQDGLPDWLEREAEPTVAHPRAGRAPTPAARSGRVPTPARATGLGSASTLAPMPPLPTPPSDPFFSGTPMVTITPRNATDVFEDAQPGRRSNPMVWIGALVVGLGVVLIGGVLVFFGGAAVSERSSKLPPPGEDARTSPPPAEVVAVDPPAADVVAAVAPPANAADGAAAKADTAAKADAAAKADVAAKADTAAKAAAATKAVGGAPVPPRAPAPVAKPAPGGGSVKSLTDGGWKAIDKGDLPKAHGYFSRALQRDPNSAWALYGRGYANEKMGDAVSARSDYCDAMSTGGTDTELRRELEGGLRRLGQRCN